MVEGPILLTNVENSITPNVELRTTPMWKSTLLGNVEIHTLTETIFNRYHLTETKRTETRTLTCFVHLEVSNEIKDEM